MALSLSLVLVFLPAVHQNAGCLVQYYTCVMFCLVGMKFCLVARYEVLLYRDRVREAVVPHVTPTLSGLERPCELCFIYTSTVT